MYKIIGADQKEYGPVSAEQLRQWISDGRINAVTKIRLEGAADWKNASEFPEFAPLLVGAPPVAASPAPVALPPSTAKTNQMALWAMITGIVSLVCCQSYLGLVSIVLGIFALSKIKQTGQDGAGFAIVGIVLGIVALILVVLIVVAYISAPQMFSNFPNAFNQ